MTPKQVAQVQQSFALVAPIADEAASLFYGRLFEIAPHLQHRSAIRIRNDYGELDRLTRWIIETCDAAQLSNSTAFRVQLCLEEAVANILEHGQGGGRASAITADLNSSDPDVILNIEDDGAAFDPRQVATPLPSHNLENASMGGRGIHLIRQFSSSMEYVRANSHNRLRLKFYPVGNNDG
jgi:anti-sigma regulatory factor (Ser/Thr protein kinase)